MTTNSLDRARIAEVEGILFDMDGVLINSEPVHEASLLELSTLLGRRFETHADLQVFKGLPELTSANLLLAQFPQTTLTAPELIQRLLTQTQILGKTSIPLL